MLSPLRNRFGIPGVISVIALVFAMLGGAYAASQDNGKATASAKAKRGPKGPKGATGPAGPAGPAGPQGPAGANGKDGSNGTNGSSGATGAAGATGKSVVTGTATALQCEEGGITVEVEGSGVKKPVCNGEAGVPGNTGATGPQGPQGEPWTAGGTLPVGETETGVWELYANEAGNEVADASFTIPLQADLGEAKVHVFDDADFAAKCTGSVANPTAPSGELCVYGTALIGNLTAIEALNPADQLGGGGKASKTGAIIIGVFGAIDIASGTWAVTG